MKNVWLQVFGCGLDAAISAIPYKEELEPLLKKGISWVLSEA